MTPPHVGENTNYELHSNWCRYLCILTACYIEQSFKEIAYEYSRRINPEMAAYVEKSWPKGKNFKKESIATQLGKFKKEWKQEFEAWISDQQEIGQKLDNLVDKRNRIAHGHDDGIGFITTKDYYENVAIKIVEKIESLMLR